MRLDSPAKVNLFLHVTGRRPDGYHTLDTLMCPIDLCDRVEIERTSGEFGIFCTDPSIPADGTNLAMRAARLFMDRAGLGGGVRIRLEKTIPAGAGLGGGSGNAAAVLNGLNRLCGFPFSEEELMEMGLGLGADVPFFIRCRPARATGIGEVLEFCEHIRPWHMLLLFAGGGVSTARVYKNLNLALTNSEKKINSPLLNEGELDPVSYLHNDLELPAQALDGTIAVLKELAVLSGAEGVLMTGSGSAVFGLYADGAAAETAREEILGRARSRSGLDGLRVFKTQLIV